MPERASCRATGVKILTRFRVWMKARGCACAGADAGRGFALSAVPPLVLWVWAGWGMLWACPCDCESRVFYKDA